MVVSSRPIASPRRSGAPAGRLRGRHAAAGPAARRCDPAAHRACPRSCRSHGAAADRRAGSGTPVAAPAARGGAQGQGAPAGAERGSPAGARRVEDRAHHRSRGSGRPGRPATAPGAHGPVDHRADDPGARGAGERRPPGGPAPLPGGAGRRPGQPGGLLGAPERRQGDPLRAAHGQGRRDARDDLRALLR